MGNRIVAYMRNDGTTEIRNQGKVRIVPTSPESLKRKNSAPLSMLWKPDQNKPCYAEDAYGRSKAQCKSLEDY